MNLFIKLLVIFSLAFLGIVEVKAQESKADVFIKCSTDSAVIFINKKIVGKGSVKLRLNEGKYYLMIVSDTLLWGNRQVIYDTLKIYKSKKYNFSYKFRQAFYLRTKPEDAFVYKTDSLIGYTPLFLFENFDVLRLEKNGYETKRILSNQFNYNKVVDLKFNGKVFEKPIYERNIFKILIGTIVILGGTTAFFKLKADNYFGQYQNTGKSEFLNQTRKYDLISGITMGALQINFGILIYYFLED